MEIIDIIFETEQDLIDFQTAGYTKVRGNVIVSGGEITTLQKLDNLLTEINGSLRLECSTLTTLDGLYGLKTITDSLIIKDGDMTSFEGLRNLGTIGGNFKVIAEPQISLEVSRIVICIPQTPFYIREKTQTLFFFGIIR